MSIKSISQSLAKKLVEGGAEPKLERVYAYGIEGTLTTGIILFLLLVSGLLLGKVSQMLVFIIAWLPLRVMVGGIHANTHLACTIISVVIGIISVSFTEQINTLEFYIIAIAVAICYIIFYVFSPVVHKNHPISDAHRKKMRLAARLFSLVECIFILILAYCRIDVMPTALMACISTALMEVLGWMSKDAIKTYE